MTEQVLSSWSNISYFFLAGPKTNWIVGTKASIGVDSNTVIIDKLTDSGEVRDLKSNIDLLTFSVSYGYVLPIS